MHAHTPPIRKFDTGATRNAEAGKLDFEGFLSPLVLKRYAEYMDSHRKMPDGSLRDSDNWQRGIPLSVYIKSAWRHFFDLWREHRGIATADGLENDACALLFNVSGYLHEHLKASAAANTARQLYDETSAIAAKQDKSSLPTREEIDAGYAADAWGRGLRGIPAESAYLRKNGSRIATPAEVDGLREVLTAEELRGFGIGDVAETATTVATSQHPANAEALRYHDERLSGPEDHL